MIKKLIYYISLSIILIPNLGISQFNFNISYNGRTDDNLYRSPTPVQDYISLIGLGANYKIQDTGLSIYNNLDFLNYNENTSRSFLLNNLGFSNYINITEDQFSKIYFGGNWNLRVNKEEYNYYNYSQITGYTNVQHFFRIALLKGGYNYRWRNYTNWSDLSNHLHNAFIQLNKSFPTRTTIIIHF